MSDFIVDARPAAKWLAGTFVVVVSGKTDVLYPGTPTRPGWTDLTVYVTETNSMADADAYADAIRAGGLNVWRRGFAAWKASCSAFGAAS